MMLTKIFFSFLIFLLILVGMGWFWVNQPLSIKTATALVWIKKGESNRKIVNQLQQHGIDSSRIMLLLWFRLSGNSRYIKAGLYEINPKETARSLLLKLVNGEQKTFNLTLIDGWTFGQIRNTLANAPYLIHSTENMSNESIMQELDKPKDMSPEGRFSPDTYQYVAGSSDLDILKNSMREMDKALAKAWKNRIPTISLSSKEQLLIMASLIEKETALPEDRPMIAAVLENRLRIGMRLQTDPSVIYGMGERYHGVITRADLKRDTPWNTYTRYGLPPTPIAIPSKGALQAASQPAKSDMLYFVAMGDGRSAFSDNLSGHNKLVQRYIKNAEKN